MQILEIKTVKPDKQINKLTYFLTLGNYDEIVEKPCRPRQIREIKKSKKKRKKSFVVKKIILSALWKDEIKNILIKVKPRRKISKGKNQT